MIYNVKATYNPDKLLEFGRYLTDGTIAGQKPDGPEIVDSMKRAKITAPAQIEWYEKCYCPTPLQHERRTIYDKYIIILETEETDHYGDVQGESFWSVLTGLLEE